MKRESGLKILGNLHFWAVLALFAVCCLLHYPGQLPWTAAGNLTSLLGLQRHALERILFLAPIAYAAYIFGIRGGILCLLLAALALLPRVFLLSPAPRDALLETVLALSLGGLIIGWLETRRREIGRREQDILRLESVKKQLQSHVRAARGSERRIQALHSISRTINQSFSLEEVAAAVVEPIRELLHAETVLIYLSASPPALELKAASGLAAELERRPDLRRLEPVESRDLPPEGPLPLSAAAGRERRQFKALIRRLPGAPLWVMPFRARDLLMGLLCVALPPDAAGRPEDGQRERLLSLLGSELGAAAERAYYFRELERVSLHFREVFEKAHDAIWLQDRDGDIISANQAAARLSGYSREELIRLNAARLFGAADENRARAQELKLLGGKPVRQPYEQTIVKKNGSRALLMQTTSLLGDPQAPVFLHIARDISDERRLRESLRSYAGQISRAHEDERLRVARELHDDTIQTLISLYARLDRLLAEDPCRDEQSRRQLEEIHSDINACMIRIRRFVQDLRPPTLDYLGLFPTLRELAAQTSEQSGLRIDLRGSPSREPMAAEEELLVYRIVQEALRNIVKHAGDAQAEIRIADAAGILTVEVEDNGRGFTVDAEAELVEKGKLGLMGMKERAYLLGGELEIRAAPGKGTRIRLAFPRRRA
jgi:two-component system sensor histidine kinase DegS